MTTQLGDQRDEGTNNEAEQKCESKLIDAFKMT